LVFAAYCGKELRLRADGDNAVEILCAPQEGSPKLLASSFRGVQIRPRTVSGWRDGARPEPDVRSAATRVSAEDAWWP